MSIREIQRKLHDRKIYLSTYAIWKIVRKEELRDYKELLDNYSRVYVIDVLPISGRYLLILVDVKNDCDVLFITRINDNRLSTVCDALHPYIVKILEDQKKTPVFVIPRIRPLSLGPNGMNKLTKIIMRLRGETRFLMFTRRTKKFRQKIITQLEKSTS